MHMNMSTYDFKTMLITSEEGGEIVHISKRDTTEKMQIICGSIGSWQCSQWVTKEVTVTVY